MPLTRRRKRKIAPAARLRWTAFQAAAPEVIDTTPSPPVLKPGGETRLRPTLLDIPEEMHWAVQRKFHSRPIQKSATRRLVWIGMLACFLFILPYIYIYLRIWMGDDKYTLPFDSWPWLPLWTAITSGFFGAMFSRLLYLQSNWDTLSLGSLKDARDYSSILLRGSVGTDRRDSRILFPALRGYWRGIVSAF